MIRRALAVLSVAVWAAMVAARGSSSTAPSGTNGASLNGTLQAGSTASTLRSASGPRPAATSFAGKTVTVLGTTFSTTVDANNQFTLSGLSAGTVTLQFQGPNVSALVAVNGVTSGDTISAFLLVEDGTIVLSSGSQMSGTTIEQHGTISAILSGSSFSLNGLTIFMTSSTTIIRRTTILTFADLASGMRVLVTRHAELQRRLGDAGYTRQCWDRSGRDGERHGDLAFRLGRPIRVRDRWHGHRRLELDHLHDGLVC